MTPTTYVLHLCTLLQLLTIDDWTKSVRFIFRSKK